MLLCVRVLDGLGLWPGPRNTRAPFRCFLIAFAIILHLGSEVVQVYLARSNLPEVITIAAVSLTGIGSISKLCNTFFRPAIMHQMINELASWAPPHIERRLSAVILISWIGNVLLWLVAPIIRQGDDLPFIAWFPGAAGAPFGSPPYWMSYTFQFCTGMVVVITTASVDGLFAAMLLALMTRLKTVQRHLQEGKSPSECAVAHQEALASVPLVQSSFGPLMLLQFGSSCFIICTVGFLVFDSSDQTVDRMVKSAVYLVVGIMQLLVVCAFGELVTSAGTEVGTAAYNAGWEATGDPKQTRLLSLIITRAQKPVHLLAGGLYPVTLNSFASVLNTSYSYFALLRTMSE